MTFEIRRVNAASAQSHFKVFATMQPLTAGCNFHSLEQQIEAICGSCHLSRSCVERAPDRKSNHEYGGDTCLLFRKLAQLSLGIGVEIVVQLKLSFRNSRHFLKSQHGTCSMEGRGCFRYKLSRFE